MCQLILLLFYINFKTFSHINFPRKFESFFLYDETYELQLILGSTICGMHGAVVVGNYKKIVV